MKALIKGYAVSFIFTWGMILIFTGICMATGPKDVGMVTMLKGNVKYHNKNKDKKHAAQNFMKVRTNDTMILGKNSEIQIIYFVNGKKETWQGPAHIKIGEKGASIIGDSAKNQKPVITKLPSLVAKELKKISPLVDPSKLHRSGSSLVRGKALEKKKAAPLPPPLDDEEKEAVKAAKETYNALLKSSGEDDITPELFLFSFLAEYDRFDDMRSLLKTMRKKQPENKEIDRLEKWLNDQI